MRKIYVFGLIALASVLIGVAWAEQITLTTYYPAPYGIYKQLQTTSKTNFATNTLGTGLNEDAYAKVGIGTETPTVKLEVVGGPVKTTGGLIIPIVSSLNEENVLITQARNQLTEAAGSSTEPEALIWLRSDINPAP